MDVVRARFLRAWSIALLPLAFAACGNESKVQSATFPATKAACAATAVPNRFLVRWKDGTTSVETATDRETFIREFIEPNEDDIEFAEHDQVVKLAEPGTFASVTESADDTAADWGQALTGAYNVWAQGIDGSGVTVAVIDSGVDRSHRQIAPRLAINTGEIPNNNIDDDHNGYVDDVAGYDFDQRSGMVVDGSGHGTHVAGIVLADHASGSVRGMAPGAKLLPLDFMNDEGAGNLSLAIEAIHYAAARGAKVINASWGGAPCSKTLYDTISDLEAKGVLFVSAAGNAGVDLERNPEYPAAYVLGNQITVGASTPRDYMTAFTNFSFNLVHLMAPGLSIQSTYPAQRTASMSGTSMAAPFVSGAAALLWSVRPNATPAQIKAALISSVDKGNFAASSGGRLNVERAVAEIRKLAP